MALWRQVHADPEVLCVQVPLPRNALRTVNAYVVRDEGQALVIDTGFDHEECLRTLGGALREMGLRPGGYDLFVTHEHTDHYGLLARLRARTVYLSELSLKSINATGGAKWVGIQARTLREEGFSDDQAQSIAEDAPTANEIDALPDTLKCIGEGDRVTVGRFSFSPIHTPGHARGHLCLYLAQRELLFTGDHILFDISPNITHWTVGTDPLADYLASLRKVRDLPVSIALPGHREPRAGIAERVDELLEHHEERLADCLRALSHGDGRLTVDVAGEVSWAGRRRFQDLSPAQQLFAAGETRAHLEHLVYAGEAVREEQGGRFLYRL